MSGNVLEFRRKEQEYFPSDICFLIGEEPERYNRINLNFQIKEQGRLYIATITPQVQEKSGVWTEFRERRLTSAHYKKGKESDMYKAYPNVKGRVLIEAEEDKFLVAMILANIEEFRRSKLEITATLKNCKQTQKIGGRQYKTLEKYATNIPRTSLIPPNARLAR